MIIRAARIGHETAHFSEAVQVSNLPVSQIAFPLSMVGAVAIGRNEGDRLIRCFDSLQAIHPRIVYVDSGSTDRSVEWARKRGIVVEELDAEKAFTAARARNAGWRRLQQEFPEVGFVQFLDGDCELIAGWLETALEAFAAVPTRGVVCGRRRERHPDRSIYNRLCDLEWNTPLGKARACGGDALMRLSAVEQVGGYNDSLIAGEEPELCLRLRTQGWTIERLDADMTWHDAAITRFGQWFRRARRAGHAYAEGAALHGSPPERHCVRETRRIWLWALVWPLLLWLASLSIGPWSLLGLSVYAVQVCKTAWQIRARADRLSTGVLYGIACVLAKWPQLIGQCQYWVHRWRGRRMRLIEYKDGSGGRSSC